MGVTKEPDKSAMIVKGSFRDAESILHDQAAQITGLSDFGPYEEYREGLQTLLDAIDRETCFGGEDNRQRIFTSIRENLIGRLRSQQGWKETPECLKHRIGKPIMITGLPRTGTTALHQLLAEDPQFQGHEYWLIDYPSVRPPRDQWESHPGYLYAVAKLNRMYEAQPKMKTAHLILPDAVYETIQLLKQCFWSVDLSSMINIPSYERWLLAHDTTPDFRRYGDNLRLIGYLEPERRWLLKCPLSLFGIGGFIRAFPDALVIQTHRNPVISVASGCSLAWMSRQYFEGPESPREVAAKREYTLWGEGMRKAMVIRDAHEQNFHDVFFDDFSSQPMSVVRGIYQAAGMTLSEGVVQRMEQWLQANPQGKHGEHKYNLEGFGMTENDIKEHFSDYMARFGYQ